MDFEEDWFPAINSKEALVPDMATRNGIHFIGIGGIGMSGLAQIYMTRGFQVSGSDISSTELTRRLGAAGARIFVGHGPENIGPYADNIAKVVLSTAIAADNSELLEARRLGLPIYHRSDLLAELFLDAPVGIAVAGCHGKTTITSMLSTILVEAGRDPTCVVGGNVKALNGNARPGNSGIFVAEADESDATFLKYFPHSAIITNIDNDHLDHYSSLESIAKAFEIFANHIAPDGTLFLCNDDANIRTLAAPENRRVVTYGIDNPSDVMASDVVLRPFGSTFQLTIGGILRESIELSVPGRHNVLNSLPVIALCLDLGLSLPEIQAGLQVFRGAGRRFEVKGTSEGVTVIDDYGHHPNEIRATLAAARNLGAKRILVVFQPHRYTRTQLLCREFGRAFNDCDKLFIAEIYPSSEKPIPGVTSKLILDQMPIPQRRKAKLVKNLDDLPFFLTTVVEPGDVVFTLGAGSVTNLGPELLESLRARAAKNAHIQANPAV